MNIALNAEFSFWSLYSEPHKNCKLTFDLFGEVQSLCELKIKVCPRKLNLRTKHCSVNMPRKPQSRPNYTNPNATNVEDAVQCSSWDVAAIIITEVNKPINEWIWFFFVLSFQKSCSSWSQKTVFAVIFVSIQRLCSKQLRHWTRDRDPVISGTQLSAADRTDKWRRRWCRQRWVKGRYKQNIFSDCCTWRLFMHTGKHTKKTF